VDNVNVTIITGNLTRDPELRYLSSGTAICEMRIAVNGSRRVGEEWVDKPNFFNVTAFAKTAENASRYLHKGSKLLVEGRLDWSEWTAKDDGGKRQAVKIIAEKIQYLDGVNRSEEREDGSAEPAEAREPAGVAAGGAEDDIPF
jgi:single-strand DNA-binding protein